MIKYEDAQIRMIPMDQIMVLNPRQRGRRKHAQIADNIGAIGLKKPVTVSLIEGKEGDGEKKYWLVCGQGRLESYESLGQQEIPAIMARGTKEDFLLASLAENLARRNKSALEHVRKIRDLKDTGYNNSDIARKTHLDTTYVRAIIQLLDKGEDRLLVAVDKEQIPVSIAITIATADDKSVQRALTEAYEKHDLRGKALLRARRLIQDRRSRGKKVRGGKRRPADDNISAEKVLKAYKDDTIRQKLLVQKAKVCETRLLFVVTALRQLFADDNFVNLLRAESLDTVPQYLSDKIKEAEVAT
jgi:ParB family chromosome partitioning protein